MTGEEWARYLSSLKGDLHEFATNLVRRISRVLNQNRLQMQEDTERLERERRRNTELIREVESHQLRYVAQQDRLEERVDAIERTVQALAEALARHVGQVDADHGDG